MNLQLLDPLRSFFGKPQVIILIWVNCDFQAEKRSLYVDMRDDGEEDNMANWDEEKLKEVVAKKHAEEKSQPNTDIVS